MSPETLHKIWHDRITHAKDYRHENQVLACGLLAVAFAQLLEKAGRPWKIVCFQDEDFNKALKPAPFPHLEWYGHMVCLSENLAFDPILPKPTKLGEYEETLFPEQKVRHRSMEPGNIFGPNEYLENLPNLSEPSPKRKPKFDPEPELP